MYLYKRKKWTRKQIGAIAILINICSLIVALLVAGGLFNEQHASRMGMLLEDQMEIMIQRSALLILLSILTLIINFIFILILTFSKETSPRISNPDILDQ